MNTFSYRSVITQSADEVFSWHTRAGALERLSPPWQSIQIIERTGFSEDGRVVLLVALGPFRKRWVARLFDVIDGSQFCDEQVEGPFSKWVHVHRVVPETEQTCLLEDQINYQLPVGTLGAKLGGPRVNRELARMFAFRHERTARDLALHSKYRTKPRLRIILSGSSGLIGSALAAFLTSGGHRVDRLVRRQPAPGSTDIFWDPARATLDPEAVEGADAVIHLAGETIAGGRWTPKRKATILQSRVLGTKLISETLTRLTEPPKLLISASAIGYYGDRGAQQLTESSAAGSGFVSQVCQAWEDAAKPVTSKGIRLVKLRTGIVLTTAGGALSKMLPPFRVGLGGPIGRGRHYMSWISLDDWIGIVNHLLFDATVEGPVNVVAPESVLNSEFTQILGSTIGLPALLPVPPCAIRFAFGQMGEEILLSSARVIPAKMLQAGYQYLTPSLGPALAFELGKPNLQATKGEVS